MSDNKEKQTDIRLVKKAIRGNAEAYGLLVAQHQEYLYKMAFIYMQNEEDALDVVQTTVLKGYQHIKKLKNPEWFKTWLTSILIHTAADAGKKIVYYSDIESRHISARQIGVSLEEKCDLNEAILKLPEKYRTAIILKYFSQMSVDEIARTMNAPSGTVKAWLSRGRDEIKKYLKEDYMYAKSI